MKTYWTKVSFNVTRALSDDEIADIIRALQVQLEEPVTFDEDVSDYVAATFSTSDVFVDWLGEGDGR